MECWKTNCVLGIVAFLAVVANAKRGFILTAPKVLKTGTIEHLTLTLFEIHKESKVTVQLLKQHNNDVLVETTVIAIPDHSVWIELLIPNVPYKKARLRIHGVFEQDDYRIDEEKEVYLEQKSLLIFVQTDKPIYKPGQIVSFRVFPVDIRLQPADRQTVGDVWIENPIGIRVEQWKNISFAKGLVQLSLPLSNEATLGEWIIYSQILGKTEEQKFEVAKYVLPRFEVIATPQRYLLANATTVTWEICAKYTYGKKVEGVLHGNVTFDLYHWEKSSKIDKVLPFVDFEKPISGCTEVKINTADLIFDARLNSRGLVLSAEVAEADTDIVQKVRSKINIHSEPFKINILKETGNYFKPGIPYRGKIEITTPDGVPVIQQSVSVCFCNKCTAVPRKHAYHCKKFTSNEDGHIYFTVPPQNYSVEEVHIKAEASHVPSDLERKLKKPVALVVLSKWFSRSRNYIQIEPPTRTFSCESLEEVKVIYTPTANPPSATRIKFYHQIISRGQIVKQGAHWRTFNVADEKGRWSHGSYINDKSAFRSPPTNGEFIFKFDSRSFMSPIARLLVFYVHPSGETIADSRAFVLNECLSNKVNMTFTQQQQYPGSKASIKIKAEPNSLCGVTAVDKSVHLMKSGSKFNRHRIFDILKKYDLNEHSQPFPNVADQCVNTDPYIRSQKMGIDENDLRRRKRSSFYPSFPVGADAAMAFEGAGMIVLSDLTLITKPCLSFPRMEFISEDAYFLKTSNENMARERSFNNIHSLRVPSGSVLTVVSKPTSAIDNEESLVRSYFPETWLWELQDVGESGEIIIERQLPHTITKWMGNSVCINHQSGLGISDTASIVTFKPFFVSMILPYSVTRGEKAPIIVKVFNYLSDCLPILLMLEPTEDFEVINNTYTQKLCICGSESETRRFMIQPNVLGNISLTVNGYPLDDELCNGQYTPLMYASDSASRTLLVVAEGFYQEETEATYFCPKDYPEETFTENIAISFPDGVVEGSELAYLSLTGDIMGPSLNGLQKLVRLPVGCGEQNMVLFAPNIFVLDYLTSTNRLTDDVKVTLLDYMKTGYQRELNYRHGDGSYSAFGSSDASGSMWLTAFVLKSFSQARRYIDIDENDLSLSKEWIIKKQLENGCFPTVGQVLHQAMKGGVSEHQQTFTTLTAYTVISLLESGFDKSSKVMENALLCIHSEPNPKSYSLALFAYASALAGDPIAVTYLQRLSERATHKDGMLYWDSEYKSSRSVSVEVGAYSILAFLQLGGRENIASALSIVRWIIQQRNSNGGFVSTQDTVIALQALAKYATITGQSNVDMTVIAEGRNFEENLHLSEENKLVMQSIKVPNLPNNLRITASGDGCALIEVHRRYNMKSIPASAAFQLRVTPFKSGSSDCNKPNIKICVRYKINDEVSNMAVIEANMISGYVPDDWSLQLLNEIEDLSLKRYEINSNSVVFYFDELTNEEKCFHFTVVQDFEVEDAKPAIVKLYDYYEQESFVAVNYSIQSKCLEDLPNIETLLNGTTEPSDGIQQLDIEFVNMSAIISNNDDSERNVESQSSTVRSLNNTNSLDGFVNINHELDFPDGLEGNIPFTVMPPQRLYRPPVPPRPIPSFAESLEPPIADDTIPAPSCDFASVFCPLCVSTLPSDFYHVYCNSSFALLVESRNAVDRRMKIIYDFTPRLNRIERVNEFAGYSEENACCCSSNDHKNLSGMQFLMIGKIGSLWQSEPQQHVTVNRDILIIPVHEIQLMKSMKLPRFLRESQRMCVRNSV